MRRRLGSLVPLPLGLLLALSFASPSASARLKRLPIPPASPPPPASAEPAPIPNLDMQPPLDPLAARSHFAITDFRSTNIDNSAGFGHGAQYRSAEDQRAIQTPGLALKVPVQ